MQSKNLIVFIIVVLICFGYSKNVHSIGEKSILYKKYQITFEGRKRLYLVHIPPEKFLNKALPLLFCIHGGGGSAKGMIKLTINRFNELADQEGFIVVYPEAVEKNWNDGRKDINSVSHKENINDVGFIAQIVEELKKLYKIDQKKIFTCGISNGGFMSDRLGCEMSETFSGIAIIAATMGADFYSLCKPTNPIKVLIMNGTKDPLVPYKGGDVVVFKKKRGKVISTNELIEFWVNNNKCNSLPIQIEMPDKNISDSSNIVKFIYESSNNNFNVVLYKINNGGHCWPGGKQYLKEKYIGNTCSDINACDEIWNFFKN